MAVPKPQPFNALCVCGHTMNLHRPIGEGAKRRHGPCSTGTCDCTAFSPERAS